MNWSNRLTRVAVSLLSMPASLVMLESQHHSASQVHCRSPPIQEAVVVVPAWLALAPSQLQKWRAITGVCSEATF